MEDEDGTCLLDVLCDPQALNDFLHGTHELQNEDLLISSSSGEPSLFTDAPSPVSLLADDSTSQDTPPPGCVDLSFLEEALLASPDGGGDLQGGAQGGGGGGGGEEGEEEEEEEEETCDILQQSLQEADITEQTMALEAGLAQPGDVGLSLYPPGALLPPPPAVPYHLSKSITFPAAPATLPRDTQAAVEPPQPSLLAVGPGCPSLKPTAPQLMGLLPGNVFPAPPPGETSFSLSPAQASSMLIHKAVPSLTGRPLLGPTLRATAAPGIFLQRGHLPIQPKMPISIQPRLVQISPKPPGQQKQNSRGGLTFVPGTASPNILLSGPPPGPKPPTQPQPSPHLPKPVSLQLVNQGGSFVIQPQGLFQGQNQFILPGQSPVPVTIAQPAGTARPLLTTPGHQGVGPGSVQGVTPATGHLVDTSQILTMPHHRQLNFSPVFTTPTGQLALRQGTLLSGPLQLQSAPPTVFQMPAQLAGAYTPQGPGQRATLVHSPALGNHITLINSSGMLTQDQMSSISILNGPPVVQGLPFASQGGRALGGGGAEGQLNVHQTSVVLLPDRPAAVLEERSSISEEQFQPLPQPNRHFLQHASLRPSMTGLQSSSSPPVVALLQAPQEVPQTPELPLVLAKHLMPQIGLKQVVGEVHSPVDQTQAFIHHLQQQALSSPTPPPEVETLQVAVEPIAASPLATEREAPPPMLPPVIDQTGVQSVMTSPCVSNVVTSPLHPEAEDTPTLACASSPAPASESVPPPSGFSSPPSGPPPALSGPASGDTAPQVQTGLFNSRSPLSVSVCVPQEQPDPPLPMSAGSTGETDPAVQQHTQSKPTAALAVDDKAFTLDVHPPSPTPQGHQGQGQGPLTHTQHAQAPQIHTALPTGSKMTGAVELEREERLTPAMRRHRVQQQLYADRGAVQNPYTCSPFSTMDEAVRHLLPYHTSAGHLPTQADFSLVDEQFDTVSGFLLKRTKDMLNKYRQLLFGEAQQESPSAEMVMLERLFLQSERFSLGEDRRRARRDPESYLMALRTSASSPHGASTSGSFHVGKSGSPPSPPAWARLSDRPPGLKTYRSSTRGALRLTIKHESGSRKVVHNSACDSVTHTAPPTGHKRDYSGQLTNGGGGGGAAAAVTEHNNTQQEEEEESHETPHCRPQLGTEISNGAPPPLAPTTEAAEEVVPSHCDHRNTEAQIELLDSQTTGPNSSSLLTMPSDTQVAACFELPPPPPRDVSGPKLKRYKPESVPQAERASPPPPPLLPEDSMLSEHLQSAIDSILELQRLQGGTVTQQPRGGQQGSALDQAVTSILEGVGHL